MLKTLKLKITGMHCRSCKTLIEAEIDESPGVKNIIVDFNTGEATVEYETSKINQAKIAKEIEKMNYKTSVIKQSATDPNSQSAIKISYKKIAIAVTLAIIFISGYFLIGKLGLMEILAKLNEPSVSIGFIFIIGLLASFHCVGMCGGLIVAYSAADIKNKNQKKSIKPHIAYNLGRLISYTLIGAILGGVGSFFAINPSFSGYVLLFASAFMILFGLSLLTELKWLDKLKLKTPDFIARFLFKNKHSNKPKGPFIIGLLTAFMPCGPLQAMQLFALTTGSFWQGAMAMGVYALGTIPLLLGFGGIIALIKQAHLKKLMRFSGVIVIFLGIIMFNRGLANFGIGLKSLIPERSVANTELLTDGNEYQTIEMDVTYSGYKPNVLYIKKDVPVRWIINGDEITGCTNAIEIPELGIKKDLRKGKNIIEFTPTKLGEIKFSCWMKMVWGKFIVTDANAASAERDVVADAADLPSGGSCGGSGSCGGTCGQSSCACGG